MSGYPVQLVAVGKPRTPGLGAAIAHYERRLARYFRFHAIEVAAAGLPDERAPEARKQEAERLWARVEDGARCFALTRGGDRIDTRTLAARLAELANYGSGGATFLIGGAHGLDRELLTRADQRVSLSSLTLPHELARLVLTEQLYRAGTIQRGEPYHKGR